MPPDPCRLHPRCAVDTDVLVVGAGPSGLTLAAALAARGVRTTVIDRQAEGANTSRAAVVHARTLEVLEPLGVARRLVARGLQAQRFTIRDRDRVLMPIDFERPADALPVHVDGVAGGDRERAAGALRRTRRDTSCARARWSAWRRTTAASTATLDDGSQLRARYVVGADGMHSTVREQRRHRLQRRQLRRVVRAGRRAPERRRAERRGDPVLLAGRHGGGGAAARRRAPHRRDGRRRARAATTCAYVQALLDTRGPKARARRGARGGVGFALSRSPPRGRRLSRRAACCWPAMPPTCTARPAARA